MHIHSHGTGIQKGITALELMVTLSIAAILLAIGIPSLQQFTQRQHMKSAVTGLQQDLLLARSQSVYRNAIIVACPGGPADGCSGSPNWSGGWIVFEDENRDEDRQSKEPLIRHGQALEQVDIRNSSGRSAIRFFPDGSTPGTNTSLSLCGLDGPPGARKIVISNIGRIRRDTWPDLDSSRCPG
jgi:type IV fimbrial biogenesis protein FimT